MQKARDPCFLLFQPIFIFLKAEDQVFPAVAVGGKDPLHATAAQLFSPEQLTEIYRCCADSVDGDFFELAEEQEIEKYLADQFPLRDGWITVKTLTERLSEKAQISGVYFGKDGYLIDTFTSYDQTQFSANIEALAKLLILKDSYANCFSQFVIDDYSETHLIDPRFFKDPVTDYIAESNITQVLVLYNIPNFTQDTAIATVR